MTADIVIIRILIALLVGGIIGAERSNHNSPAGLRTYILAAVSMCMVSLIQLSIYEKIMDQIVVHPETLPIFSIDLVRLSGQAVSGIGFIGAGMILHHKSTITGLTTAAAIWAVGIAGLAVGYGYYAITLVGGAVILLTLHILSYFQYKYINHSMDIRLVVYSTEAETVRQKVLDYMMRNDVEIRRVQYSSVDDDEFMVTYDLHLNTKGLVDKIVKDMYFVDPAITSVEKFDVEDNG